MPSQTGESVRLRLLGSFELEVNGKPVRLPTRKAEALLAYLVIHRANDWLLYSGVNQRMS